MIVDIYLRAADRETIDAALAAAKLTNGEGRPESPDIRWSRIGTISRPTGAFADDGAAIMADIEGYHVNLRLLRDATDDELGALASVTIAPPATPYRVWFD